MTTQATHPLLTFVTKGPNWRVQGLLKQGADPNSLQGEHGRSPLWKAAEHRKRKIVEYLLLYRANVDEEDHDQRTPLSIAAQADSLEIVQTLLKSGAMVDSQDRWHRTPLSYAAEAGNPEVIAFLLKEGADRGLRGGKNRLNPLLYSSTSGQDNMEKVQALLKVDPFVSEDGKWRWDHHPWRPQRFPIEERFLDEAWHIKPGWDWRYDSDRDPIFFNINGEEIKGIQCKEARVQVGDDSSVWAQWY